MKTNHALALLAWLSPGYLAAYTLHEWGTFTSISGSDGVLLAGLEREEERLPGFVHAHDGMKNAGPFNYFAKGYQNSRPLRGVTIKMETPVIYFYSDEAFKASVKVGFQGGSISQWFPDRSDGESPPKIVKNAKFPKSLSPAELQEKQFTARGGIDFSERYEGDIEWKVDVLAPDASRGLSFKPGETLNWVRPRNKEANILKVGNEYEDYLFYRGVGNFELPVTFRVDEKETLHIDNQGKEAVPFLFVQEVTKDLKVKFRVIENGLAGGQSLSLAENDFKEAPKEWLHTIYKPMVNGLLAAGLNDDEANGMVQTWWHSYFTQPGLRVFWIVPSEKTDDILPLQVTPSPDKTVRVLVGRSEVMRPRFEQALATSFQNKADKEKGALWNQHAYYHRYGLAYQQRMEKLIKEKVAMKSR